MPQMRNPLALIEDPTNPARVMLDQFCRAVREGRDPERSHLRQVAEGLDKVLNEGQTFGRAFGLQRGQGNKRTIAQERRDQVITAELDELLSEWGPGRKHEAMDLVAKRYSRSSDTVEKLYKAHRRKVRTHARLIAPTQNRDKK